MLLIVAPLGGCGLAHGVAALYGFPLERTEPDVLDALLRPHDVWFLPETDSLAPGVMLVPGCAGTQPFHHQWGRYLSEHGFVVLLIDSFAARNVEAVEELEQVCEGERLWGFERAGDVLVSLKTLRTHSRVDPQSLHLMGFSHGGWAVMDAVLFATNDKIPPLLTALPNSAVTGVQNAIALYPYCDFGSFIQRLDWPQKQVGGLVMLAAHDQNIEPAPCAEVIAEQRRNGNRIEQITVDADHWFDNPEGFDLVPHRFSEAARERARQEVLARFGRPQIR